MTLSPKKTVALQVTMSDAYTEHRKALLKHSFFKVHDLELSEDLVQDTYAKTWRYLVRGGNIDLMRAFLYHTLNCLVIDEYRKKKHVSLEALLEKGYEPGSNEVETIINMLDGKTGLLLIQRLPEKYSAIMRMRFTQNMTLEEISLVTGQTKNAIAVQVHRGIQKLRVLYDHTSPLT